MPAQDMDYSIYTRIIDQIPAGAVVNLQGEGEPTLWPHFWQGVDYAVSKGLVPFMITNASRVDVARICASFPEIGVTIDTLDAIKAQRVGRHNLAKILDNITALAATGLAITVYSVQGVAAGAGFGDGENDVKSVRRWALDHGCKHVLLPLQTKADYVSVYPKALVPRTPSIQAVAYACRFLNMASNHYWTVTGQHLPCCYIKLDAETFDAGAAKAQLAKGVVPHHCRGCMMLTKVHK